MYDYSYMNYERQQGVVSRTNNNAVSPPRGFRRLVESDHWARALIGAFSLVLCVRVFYLTSEWGKHAELSVCNRTRGNLSDIPGSYS